MEPILTLDRISGHRLWAVTPHPADGEPVLASVTTNVAWEQGRLEAACWSGHPVGRIPVIECRCGLYASKTRVTPPTRRVWAQGPVEMWGRVIEGSRGYRAERMRIAGDVELVVGMGPGFPRCTIPGCRELAVGIATGSHSFLGRCDGHQGPLAAFADFQHSVDRSLRSRYGVGARLRGEVGVECC